MTLTGSSLPDLARQLARLHDASIALESLKTAETISYSALDQRAEAMAATMAEHGVGRGDRVAVLSMGRPEVFIALFACAKLGAILVPLNWRAPGPELCHILQDCRPSLLFTDDALERTAKHLTSVKTIINVESPEVFNPGNHLSPGQSELQSDQPWLLLYTSGTTGRPKGVIHTPRMALVNYMNIGSAISLSKHDRTLSFLPLCHAAGIHLHALPTLLAGGRVLVAERFDAGEMLALIQHERIDILFGVPTVFQTLSDHPLFEHTDLTGVRHWGSGGAPLDPALVQRFGERGVRLCNGMGMTETGPTALLMRPDDVHTHPASVGRPQLLVDARIVDEQDRPCAYDEIGELQFHGPGLTPGYWHKPSASHALYTDDGWLRTGDLARQSEDGLFFITGRRSDMFISGGENVYPIEVECALTQHAQVLEAAVIAVPDRLWGQVGAAFLRVKGDPPPGSRELSRFLGQRLSPFKVPKAFLVVEDFPRTASGKIQKHRLPVNQLPLAAPERGDDESACGHNQIANADL